MEAVVWSDFLFGVAATPTWVVGGRVVVPGAVPRDVFRSVVERLAP